MITMESHIVRIKAGMRILGIAEHTEKIVFILNKSKNLTERWSEFADQGTTLRKKQEKLNERLISEILKICRFITEGEMNIG